MESNATVETPEQLIERLGRMGEERVRGLIAKNYFPTHARPLVSNWLDEQEETRRKVVEMPHAPTPRPADDAAVKAQALARRAVAEAKLAKDAAAAAREQAQKAQKIVLTALVLGAIGVVASLGILFVLIFR